MRRCSIVLVVCALAQFVVAVPAEAATPLASDAAVLVQGHGWGHGRGMGQWGAKGMADSGKTWTQIVTHYYSGITISTRSSSESIRVLLESSPSVLVTSDSAFTAWTGSTKVATSDTTYKFLRARHDGTYHVVEKATTWTGPWSRVSARSGSIVFKPGSSVLQLVYDSGSVRYYRGTIEARISSLGPLYAINDLPMQHYLYGSVPREMPGSWAPEAVKAQAVAARTYAAYKKDYARSKGYAYDICASTMCQVYGGYASKSSPTSTSVTKLEYSGSNSAVDATAGKVLLAGGKAILSEYSSSTGGHTAPGSVSYLAPVPDPADAVSPLHNWDTVLRVADIQKKWPSIGRLVDVKVTRRNGYGDWGGRVLEMQVIGTSATVTLSGYGFMNAFAWPVWSDGLRGNWFRVLTWRGDLASTPVAPTLLGGSSATMRVLVRNTGNTYWPVGGAVRLATSSASRFAGSGWISSTRPATVTLNRTATTKKSVGPGEVAEFRFPLHAENVKPGLYRETYRVVNDALTPASAWFSVVVPVLPGWIDEAPNLLSNASFELGTTGWSPSGFASGDGVTTAAFREGARSLVLKGATKRAKQTVSFAAPGARRFTLGGWSRGDGTSPSGGAIEASALVRYADGTTSTTRLPFPRGPHAWTYDEVSFVTSKSVATVTVAVSVATQRGSAYFDAIRLQETPVANPSFEDGVASWNRSGFSNTDGSVLGGARDGVRWLRFTGDGVTSAGQTLGAAGGRTERFVVSAWNKTQGSNPAAFPAFVQVVFVNTDGTRSAFTKTFPLADHDWMYGELVVRAPKAFKAVNLVAGYNGQTGTAGFDAIRFTRNFLANPSFEDSLNSWTSYGFTTGDGLISTVVRDAARSLKLTGEGTQGVVQRIALSSGAGRRLAVSTITKNMSTSTSGGVIALVVAFENADGTTSRIWLPLGEYAHDWTFVERIVTAPKAFRAVSLHLVVNDQPGSVLFDSTRLTVV